MKERVFAYYRVSSQGQVEKDGFPRQQEAVCAFVATFALDHVGEFFEEGVTGTIEGLSRPQFAEMISYIDDRQNDPATRINAVVVERVDRLARDLIVSETIMRELRVRGVKLYAADQGALIDLASNAADPTRVLVRQLLGAMSQWEKTMLVKKLKAARDRVAERTGKPCGGNLLYGQTPQEKVILETIRSLCQCETPLSWHRIALMLNGAGFTNRVGKAWNGGTVFKIATRCGIDKPKLPAHDIREYRALRWKNKNKTDRYNHDL